MEVRADVYTEGMAKSAGTKALSRALLAALLIASPAAAAKKTMKKAAQKLDAAAQTLMSQGLRSMDNGEFSTAISLFARAVRRQPSVQAYFLTGWAHYQRGFKQGTVEAADRDDAQSAIDAYKMALSRDPQLAELPDRSRLYFSKALCEEAVESYDAALDDYKKALAAAPRKALIPLNAARLRLKMHGRDKALSNVQMALISARMTGQEKALREAARGPAFAALLGDEPIRRTLGVSPDDLLAAAGADVRGLQGRDAVRDTPASRPPPPAQDARVLDRISQGNLDVNNHRYLDAINDYRWALFLDRKNGTLTPAQIAEIYRKIGSVYNKLGQSDEAITALRQSLQQNPKDIEAHYQIALAYAVSGKTASALHALKDAFASATGTSELRRYVMLSKTDGELSAVRDLPGFRVAVAELADKIALR